jgi:hypothetical protein
MSTGYIRFGRGVQPPPILRCRHHNNPAPPATRAPAVAIIPTGTAGSPAISAVAICVETGAVVGILVVGAVVTVAGVVVAVVSGDKVVVLGGIVVVVVWVVVVVVASAVVVVGCAA